MCKVYYMYKKSCVLLNTLYKNKIIIIYKHIIKWGILTKRPGDVIISDMRKMGAYEKDEKDQ